MLGRRRGGGRIFRRGQPAGAVLVGALELVDRLGCPFLESQRSVAVGIELGEGLAPGPENLLGLDLAVLVLVRARKAPLLTVPGARFGRFEPGPRPSRDLRIAAAGRRAGPGLAGRAIATTGKRRSGAGNKPRPRRGNVPSGTSIRSEIRLHTCSALERLMSTIEETVPSDRCASAAPPRPSPPRRVDVISGECGKDRQRPQRSRQLCAAAGKARWPLRGQENARL